MTGVTDDNEGGYSVVVARQNKAASATAILILGNNPIIDRIFGNFTTGVIPATAPATLTTQSNVATPTVVVQLSLGGSALLLLAATAIAALGIVRLQRRERYGIRR